MKIPHRRVFRWILVLNKEGYSEDRFFDFPRFPGFSLRSETVKLLCRHRIHLSKIDSEPL